MSQITYSQLQLIVENAMRQNGASGDREDGWKKQVITPNGVIPNEYNFQNMRDSTAKAILDALTNKQITGTLSVASVPGKQTETGDANTVFISAGAASTGYLKMNSSTQNVGINISPTYIGSPTNLPLVPATIVQSNNKGAARANDSIQINANTDATFSNMMVLILQQLVLLGTVNPTFSLDPNFRSIAAAILTAYPGSIVGPTSLTFAINGIISSGSDTVKIGDSTTAI